MERKCDTSVINRDNRVKDRLGELMDKYSSLVKDYENQCMRLDRDMTIADELAYSNIRVEMLEQQNTMLLEQLELLMQLPSMLNIHRSAELERREREIAARLKGLDDLREEVRTQLNEVNYKISGALDNK